MSNWNETMWFSIFAGVAAKSAVVLALVWVISFLLRNRSAAARHLLWTVAFAATLALPLFTVALPSLHVPLAFAALPSVADFGITSGVAGTLPAKALSGARASTFPQPAARRANWGAWLLLLWGAGTLAALARTIAAYTVAWRLRRSARPFPDAALCRALAAGLGIRRSVDVLEIQPGAMPVAFGLFRSVILMPADASAWGAERRRLVLLHELAHVRRGDAFTRLLARTALSLYWWNPLAWVAWREFVKESERAADDVVLNAGARAADYAGHLLEIARNMHTSPVAGWAAAGAARRSQLEGRLTAILDSGINRAAPGRATAAIAVVLAAAMVAPLAALRAQDRDNSAQTLPADSDAAIRAAKAAKDYLAVEAAAKAATQSANYEAAKKLLDDAVAIRAQTAGEQSVEYAVGLIMLAEAEQKIDPKSGGDLYADAVRILGDRPEAARALTHLGVAALTRRDFAAAFDNFEHIQHVAPAQAGIALMWMAVVRQQENNADEAARLYQSAIATADPKSMDASIIMGVYGSFLRAQGRDDEASQADTRAQAIRDENAHPAPRLSKGAYRVGDGVTAPKLVFKPEPQYTEEARVAKLQGTVVLQVTIGTDGVPYQAHILRGLGLGLDENAIEAISQWRFKPGAKDGEQVPITATIEVNYRLL